MSKKAVASPSVFTLPPEYRTSVRFTLPARVVSDLRVFGVLLTVTPSRPTAAATFAVHVR